MRDTPTILLVEDDDDDLLLIRRAIGKSKLVNPVHVVRDGEEAVHYLGGAGKYSDRVSFPHPFLVLLDLHLPKQDGFEVLRWVRSQPEFADLIIVVLTASAEEHDFKRAMLLGATSYFRKPGSLEEFVSLMVRIEGSWVLLKCPS